MIGASDVPEIMQWVERIGGWAVVVWLVVWLTRRWEDRMTEHSKALQALFRGQADVREELRRQHGEHMQLLRTLVNSSRCSARESG